MSTTTPQDKGTVLAFKAATASRTKFKFTRERIATAARPLLNLPQPFTLYDTDVPGLILRRQTGTALVYWLQKRVNGRLYRVRLGQHTANADLDAMRATARDLLHRLYSGTYEAEETKRKADKAAGMDTLAVMTLLQAAEAYIAGSNPPLRKGTAANYTIAAERIGGAREGLRDKPTAQWTTADVRAAFDALCGEVKPQTASGYMRAARAVVEGWRWRHPEGRVPAHNVISLGMKQGNKSRWVTAPPRTRALRPAEVPVFIATTRAIAAASKPERATMFRLLELLTLTGLRFAEAAELQWSEVDLAGGSLLIAADRMKKGRPFAKPLGKAAVALLKAQHEVTGSGVHVFPSPIKPETPIDDARDAVAEVCKKAGVHVTPHDLRRTFIRAAALCRLPSAQIKTLVAHVVGKDVTDGYIGDLNNEVDPHANAQLVENRLLGGAV
jgi:integrase